MRVKLPVLSAAFAATLILASAAPPARAVSEVAGATFPEQVVQEVTAVQQDEQSVMQTEQQINMLARGAGRKVRGSSFAFSWHHDLAVEVHDPPETHAIAVKSKRRSILPVGM